MAREDETSELAEGDIEAVSKILRNDLEDIFGEDVRIKCYRQRDHLDVHVEPIGVKEELEERHSDITVAPYADFKITVSLPN